MLDKMPGVNKPQKKFLLIFFTTIILMRWRVNFRNIILYSDFCYNRVGFCHSFDHNLKLLELKLISQARRISDCGLRKIGSCIPKSAIRNY